ncbi:MAG: DNA gyrase inhibitor YacG [Phenylobacterium sp.]
MSPSKCPICGKPMQPDYRPFCSGRCANVDLNRWLTEGYVMPGEEDPEAPDGTPPED